MPTRIIVSKNTDLNRPIDVQESVPKILASMNHSVLLSGFFIVTNVHGKEVALKPEVVERLVQIDEDAPQP